MNTYSKYCPNVFLAKCEQQHEKFETIIVTTKYGKENECIVFNLVYKKDGYYYYSIVRSDGFNFQKWAENKANKLRKAGNTAKQTASKYWEASQEGKDFLVLAEPIKVGHHSEKRHRALIERNHGRIENAMKYERKAEQYESKIGYWERMSDQINLSMPESVTYYEAMLEAAKIKHENLKNGKEKRSHAYSLTYAKKEVNELEKKVQIARKLWE